MSKNKGISATELDKKFDEDQEDILQHFDLSKARRPNREKQTVNVDMPKWMVKALDNEAERLGITRQAVIKTRLDMSLKKSS